MADENKNSDMSTIYWDPKAEITINGAELAALFQAVDLQHVSISQVPISQLAEIYGLASSAKNVIIERMNTAGQLSNTPVESTDTTSAETVEVLNTI